MKMVIRGNCWKGGKCTPSGFARSISCLCRLFSTTSLQSGLDTCFHAKFAFSGSRTCKQWKYSLQYIKDLHYIKKSIQRQKALLSLLSLSSVSLFCRCNQLSLLTVSYAKCNSEKRRYSVKHWYYPMSFILLHDWVDIIFIYCYGFRLFLSIVYPVIDLFHQLFMKNYHRLR